MDTDSTAAPAADRPPLPRVSCPARVAAAHQRVLHQLARRELQLLAGLVWATGEHDAARAGLLVEHAVLVRRLLAQHHALERDVLWPALLRGVPPGARADSARQVADWAVQVDAVDARLDEWETAGTRWAAQPTAESRATFAVLCSRAAEALVAQTRSEESILLPLLQAHLTSGDWAELVRGAEDPIVGRPDMRVLGLALDRASAVDQARLLLTLSPAARTAWHLHGRRAHRSAVDRVLAAPAAATG